MQTVADDPAFTSASGALTSISDQTLRSEDSGYVSSILTAIPSVPLLSFITDLSSSAQGRISSYCVGVGNVVGVV